MSSNLSYNERANYTHSIAAKHLFYLMEDKKTNLALSADVTKAEDLLKLAQSIGSEICILKTHIDIVEDFSGELIQELILIAKKNQFLLFEDRKFADIGNTVKHQYQNGIYHIADWADMINAHSLPGPGIIHGLAEIGRQHNRGLILIAEMSSVGHLMNQAYMQSTLRMAQEFPDFIMGFITQHALTADPQWINFTPGIKLDEGKDALGQQYTNPEQAILKNGTDVIIVGRGIIGAENPFITAQVYKNRGWEAYLKRQEQG